MIFINKNKIKMKKVCFKFDHSYKNSIAANRLYSCHLCKCDLITKNKFSIIVNNIELIICKNCLLTTKFDNFHMTMIKDPNGEWWNLEEM